jgi:hypothetical protein
MTDRNTMTTHKAQEHSGDQATASASPAPSAVPAPRHPTDLGATVSAICGIQHFGRGGLCALFTDSSVWFTEDLGGTWLEVVAAAPPPEAARKAK